jgi:hypothetical protein
MATTPSAIADQLRPLAQRIRGNAPQVRQIVRVTADLVGDDKAEAVSKARREVLNWLQARVGKLPDHAYAGEDFEHMTPGRFAAGIGIGLPDGEYWCVRCDDPDKEIAGRTWTTEVSLARKGASSRFGLRLMMATGESEPVYTPSVPGVVRQVSESPGLTEYDRPFSVEPIAVIEDEALSSLVRLLLDPRRRRPVYAVSLRDNETDLATAPINVRKLARRCLGLAHVAVITGPMSFGLSDYLGRQFSVFRGAVRTYRPGMTEEDDPFLHPLALPTSIESWGETGPSAFVDMLVARAAGFSTRSIDEDRELPTFTKAKQVALQVSRQTRESEGGDMASLLELALQELDEQRRGMDDIEALAADEERKRIEAEQRSAAVEGTNEWLRQRVLDLEARLAQQDGPQGQQPLPDSYDQLKEWADRNLPGRVLISPRAQRDAKDSPFSDVALVYRCVEILGNEYWRMRSEGGRAAIEDFDKALKELGVRNERTGQDALLREQGDTFLVSWGAGGRKHLLEWHLKNGGNTRDPARCLRIYYFWDDDAQQVIVGSLPGHLHTRAS